MTFVFVSASGATIREGVLAAYAGHENPYDKDSGKWKYDLLPGQIDEVREIVGTRPIDTMTISFGGNDVGFASILTDMLAIDFCNDAGTVADAI